MSNNQSGKIIKDQSSLGQFSSAIAQICEEKGIDKDKVIDSIEAALAAAYKKDYGKKGQIVLAKMDENTSETSFKQLKEVVDETTRTIEEEYIPEEVHNIPETTVKSKEEIEKHFNDRSFHNADRDEELNLPKFNSERDVLLEDAKKVVKGIELGDYIEYPLDIQDQYGRIASQTAKQVIIQKIREAERESMYEEFKGREGEIINGTVQRIESGKVFIDLGKSVGVLFQSEQIPGESYRIGQRLKLYIDRVDSDPKSLGIGLSRKHPQLLAKLFELEVPEIFAGTVEIKAVAREAGMRSKIAVVSHENGIDPVGSCVGQKGTRVQAIIDELNGEKVDIIEWEDNPEAMITQALSPAKVIKVELLEGDDENKKDEENTKKEKTDDKEKEKKEEEKGSEENNNNNKEEVIQKKAVAYVKEDQLSLAIGKRGQNVRLAAKLTGWNINVEALENGDDIDEDENKKEDEKDVKKNKKDSKKEGEKKVEKKEEKENKKKSSKEVKKKDKKNKEEVKTEDKEDKKIEEEKKETKNNKKK